MSSSLIRYALQCAVDRGAPVAPVYWRFPLDGSGPSLVGDGEDDWADHNIASATPIDGGWRFEIEGSYETLTLEISCLRVEDAATVYAALLAASARFQ